VPGRCIHAPMDNQKKTLENTYIQPSWCRVSLADGRRNPPAANKHTQGVVGNAYRCTGLQGKCLSPITYVCRPVRLIDRERKKWNIFFQHIGYTTTKQTRETIYPFWPAAAGDQNTADFLLGSEPLSSHPTTCLLCCLLLLMSACQHFFLVWFVQCACDPLLFPIYYDEVCGSAVQRCIEIRLIQLYSLAKPFCDCCGLPFMWNRR
jgi:hypothetical protein